MVKIKFIMVIVENNFKKEHILDIIINKDDYKIYVFLKIEILNILDIIKMVLKMV